MVYREGYRFLQGHLTCDLMQRTKDNPLLGATRDIKGLVVASMFLIADEGVWPHITWDSKSFFMNSICVLYPKE